MLAEGYVGLENVITSLCAIFLEPDFGKRNFESVSMRWRKLAYSIVQFISEVINGGLGFWVLGKIIFFLELHIDFTGYGFAHLAT